ncbi:MAG TPA: hypothetical protein PKM95_00910 [Deltaproteobacteria bacterium]|nr:hypothetical protein [Deltaproteobacteria bacterium]
MISSRVKKWITTVLLVTCMASFSACGYFLYPERRGQEGGRVDPVVALLDAGLLLLFIVPGVIAFAVDFSSGAIYLPDGGTAGLSVIRLEGNRHLDTASLERALSQRLGRPVSLDRGSAFFFDARGKAPHELQAVLQALNSSIHDEAALQDRAEAFELQKAFL